MERVESWRELGYLIKQDIKKNNPTIGKQELKKLIDSATEDNKLKEIWEKLIEKNSKYYMLDKYLELEVYKGKVRRVPAKVGQPKKADNTIKDKRVTVRLDVELSEILNNYCQTNNISESEAIRKAIKLLNRY